jgi:hypothetical protein
MQQQLTVTVGQAPLALTGLGVRVSPLTPIGNLKWLLSTHTGYVIIHGATEVRHQLTEDCWLGGL